MKAIQFSYLLFHFCPLSLSFISLPRDLLSMLFDTPICIKYFNISELNVFLTFLLSVSKPYTSFTVFVFRSCNVLNLTIYSFCIFKFIILGIPILNLKGFFVSSTRTFFYYSGVTVISNLLCAW